MTSGAEAFLTELTRLLPPEGEKHHTLFVRPVGLTLILHIGANLSLYHLDEVIDPLTVELAREIYKGI